MHSDSSKHHPDGGATPHYDNSRIESLIVEYQTNRGLESLSAIVSLTRERALTLIGFRKTYRYETEDELLSDVNFKLMRAVDKFDPTKGSAFTFISQVITNTLCTSVMTARRDLVRHRRLTKVDLNHLTTNGEVESQHAIDDLVHRVRVGVRTTIEDSKEQDVQRWFVESFCDDGFEHRRHECGDAARTVYGVSHARSRELYDLTMLEVRRVLYGDLTQRAQIIPGRLHGTRLAWMARYAPLLDENEFTKFVVLMRNMSPFLVLLVNPESRSRRQDRNPAICRKNLEWVINGHPAATPLFE